jgi:hypothetical protein
MAGTCRVSGKAFLYHISLARSGIAQGFDIGAIAAGWQVNPGSADPAPLVFGRDGAPPPSAGS